MEIMSAHLSRFSRIGAISCGVLFVSGLQLFAQQSPVYVRNIARFNLGARVDDSVPPGSVFVPYAYAEVELNRLGAPAGGGLRVKARAARPAAVRTGA